MLSKEKLTKDEILTISVDIMNSGEYPGSEVVQLYIQDVESSVERPLKELKGFKKVYLKPGERVTITFEIDKSDLSFYRESHGKWIAEKGNFNILIGDSS